MCINGIVVLMSIHLNCDCSYLTYFKEFPEVLVLLQTVYQLMKIDNSSNNSDSISSSVDAAVSSLESVLLGTEKIQDTSDRKSVIISFLRKLPSYRI